MNTGTLIGTKAHTISKTPFDKGVNSHSQSVNKETEEKN